MSHAMRIAAAQRTAAVAATKVINLNLVAHSDALTKLKPLATGRLAYHNECNNCWRITLRQQ